MQNGTPTIYPWAGGQPAFRAWLERFYDLVELDDLLAPVFGGTCRASIATTCSTGGVR